MAAFLYLISHYSARFMWLLQWSKINLADKGNGYEGITLSEKDSQINRWVNKRDHIECNKLTNNSQES